MLGPAPCTLDDDARQQHSPGPQAASLTPPRRSSAHRQLFTRLRLTDRLAVLIYTGRASLEAVAGLIRAAMRRSALPEHPQVTCQPTAFNQYVLARCPSLQRFEPCPWAPGPISQTVLGLLRNSGSPMYQRRVLVQAPDGVELLIDWKEEPGLPDTTPILLILHGIGGDSDSRLARHLSDAVKRAGWRAAVYNRRGHGQSSVLPGPIAPLHPEPRPALPRFPMAGALPGGRVAQLAATAASTAAAAVRPLLSARRRSRSPSLQQDLASPSPAAAAAIATSPVVATGNAQCSPNASPMPPCAAEAAGAAVSVLSVETPRPLSVNGGPPVRTSNFNSKEPSPTSAAGQKRQRGRASAPPQAKEPLTKVRKLFPQHSDTDDLAQVVAHLKSRYPDAPVVALGFSQGSNALVHYLGLHANDPPPFTAAISVSNAYDIAAGVKTLRADWVTDAVVTRPIKALLRKELAAVRELAEAHGMQLDLERALSATSIRDFDEALLVPAYGFDNVEAYWAQQSSCEVLQDVRVPLLLLNNTDDPIVGPLLPRIAAAAAEANPWLLAVCTQQGGHLGWLQGWSGHAWLVDVMLEYARAAVEAANTPEPLTIARPVSPPFMQPGTPDAITLAVAAPDTAATDMAGLALAPL